LTELLEQARSLLDEASTGTVSAWPRAAALLTRQELEAALGAFWSEREPDLRWQNMRVQLACLQVYAPEVAADASWTWHALTRATHHHPYELDPTREELASLIERTERVVASLRGR
jgi:hypothetical protein